MVIFGFPILMVIFVARVFPFSGENVLNEMTTFGSKSSGPVSSVPSFLNGIKFWIGRSGSVSSVPSFLNGIKFWKF